MTLLLANPVTAVKEAVIKHAVENYAEKVLGQEYGSPGFWVALAMAVIYLPFLGPSAIPTSVLKVGSPSDASVAIAIDAPAGATHVVYWAAKPSTLPVDTPGAAYVGFTNAGVVPVAGGRATLRLACPGVYKVGPTHRVIPRHVHFRYVFGNGSMSSVKTRPVACP